VDEDERLRKRENKRMVKEKKKLASKIILSELSLMEEEMQEMKTMDNTL
jgi:hypothetical protein